jgi:isocitrate dehydrogenase, putative (fragment)
VLLLPNLYGNILTNIVCGLVGGPGITSGRNYGDEYAVFETGTRNTGKSIAGQNIANPVAMINASADLLEHLGLFNYASLIRSSIDKVLNIEKIHTPDLGGNYKTSDVIDFIVKDIENQTSI